jgi:hypothetical protein
VLQYLKNFKHPSVLPSATKIELNTPSVLPSATKIGN